MQWADVYSSQLRIGDGFTDLAPVKSIVVTDFPIFPELRDLHTVFDIRARENPGVRLTEHFEMHFVRLGDLRKRQLDGLTDLCGGLQHWLNFFMFGATTSEDKMSQLVESSPAVLAAYEEFRRFKASADMQDLERRRRRFREDMHIYASAARKDGLAKGLARGIAKGIAAGKAEGKVEGKVEGKAEEKKEIARNMKKDGFDMAVIVKMTGLSPKEIKRLD